MAAVLTRGGGRSRSVARSLRQQSTAADAPLRRGTSPGLPPSRPTSASYPFPFNIPTAASSPPLTIIPISSSYPSCSGRSDIGVWVWLWVWVGQEEGRCRRWAELLSPTLPSPNSPPLNPNSPRPSRSALTPPRRPL
eukprot:3686824-Rhodomonas_salina.1